MPKRHVIVLDKIDSDTAILSAATMRMLGIADNDRASFSSETSFYVLPASAGEIEEGQVQLPHKTTLIRIGDRLTVEPAPTSLPVPAPASNGHTPKTEPKEISWDPISDTGFGEIVGLEEIKDRVEQALYYLTHPEWFLIRKSFPPRVFLFFGPYGCGKTMLGRAMAGRLAHADEQGQGLDVRFKVIKPTDVKDPYLGMSARSLQQYLDAAREESNRGTTVILLLDEIDSLVSNRSDSQQHEEYRDIVNSVLQEVQGTRELETEARIRRLQKDPEVQNLRKELAQTVRTKGKKDHRGNIELPEGEWTKDVRDKMLYLRKLITEDGGVSTVLIVGTTNDPTRIDQGFVSRAGDNVFFIPRPPAEAIEHMLAQQLDSAFVELSALERRKLAKEAFKANLGGRDIMLSWLQPLRSQAPGSLTIMGHQSVKAHMPTPTVGIEWELDLHKRLSEKGHTLLAQQMHTYLEQVHFAEMQDPKTKIA